MASISIVIPAYNEERRLPSALHSVVSYITAKGWSFFEVLVVDDGSSDATAACVEEFERHHPEVRLLRNPGNRGKGYAVRHGILETRGDWVLFTDADLSAPIEELEKLLAAARAGEASIAIGSRALNRSLIGVHQPFLREQAGRVFNLLMRILTGLPFWDTQCGFKLFEGAAAREIFRRQRIDRFGFDVEVLFLARKLGFRTVEVPVRWNHAAGTSVKMLRDSLSMFLDLLRVRWCYWRGRYAEPAEVEKSAQVLK